MIFRKKLSEFDLSRTGKFFILGSCVVAPVIRTWYLALERIVKFQGNIFSFDFYLLNNVIPL